MIPNSIGKAVLDNSSEVNCLRSSNTLKVNCYLLLKRNLTRLVQSPSVLNTMAPETTTNGTTIRADNGTEFPILWESASNRPEFYRANPHLIAGIIMEDHFTKAILNQSRTNPNIDRQGELHGYPKFNGDDMKLRLSHFKVRFKHMDASGSAIMAISPRSSRYRGSLIPCPDARSLYAKSTTSSTRHTE